MKKEDKKTAYVLCPRCELNYIKSKEKYCTVCKAEMGLVDPSILLPDDEDVGLEKLCPVCHINYIGEDEEVCFLCQKEMEEREAAAEKDEWAELDREPGDMDTPIGILPLDDEPLLVSDDEPEEEEEEPKHAVDDFDYPEVPDDFDEDFDDEELDDEDEDEDFDDKD